MSEIPAKHRIAIRKGALDLANAHDRRKRAEEALGQPIDDPTYERLGHAKSWADIYQIANGHDVLGIWSNKTLRFLHIAAKPDVTEAYFLRTMRALRRSVTET